MFISEISEGRNILTKSIEVLQDLGVPARSKITLSRIGKIPHLRIDANIESLEQPLEFNGITINSTGVPQLSGQFDTFELQYPDNFSDETLAGKKIFIVLSIKSGGRITKKSLTPANLGLLGKEFNKDELVQTLKIELENKIQDDILYQFLLQLIDVAMKKKTSVDQEIMSQLNVADIRVAGIDFGEILAPLVFATDDDKIVFPAGNSMLADVEIGGRPISVKSATGSGTSFKAIEQHIQKFGDDVTSKKIKLSTNEIYIYKFFKAFVDTKGKNVDKIIAGSHAAYTPEHQAMEELLGTTKITFDAFKKFSKNFISYASFLEAIYPVSLAGNRGKPVGLPADHKYYLKLTDIKPKKKQAGRASWDDDREKAAANILTYILGASFLADAKQDVKSIEYNQLIKKILANVNASLIKIDITSDGKITSHMKKFSDVNFAFQYHAPSHMAGNNLPGFSIKLEN